MLEGVQMGSLGRDSGSSLAEQRDPPLPGGGVVTKRAGGLGGESGLPLI